MSGESNNDMMVMLTRLEGKLDGQTIKTDHLTQMIANSDAARVADNANFRAEIDRLGEKKADKEELDRIRATMFKLNWLLISAVIVAVIGLVVGPHVVTGFH